MLTKPDNATAITLWNGREIPRLGMGCWAIGGPFHAGDVPLGWGEVDDAESLPKLGSEAGAGQVPMLEAPRISPTLIAARAYAKDNPAAVASIVRDWVSGESA